MSKLIQGKESPGTAGPQWSAILRFRVQQVRAPASECYSELARLHDRGGDALTFAAIEKQRWASNSEVSSFRRAGGSWFIDLLGPTTYFHIDGKFTAWT